MSDLQSDFGSLVEEVTEMLKRQNRSLQVNEYGKQPKRKYSLKAPKTFAWVLLHPKLHCLGVGTKEKWALKAGISNYDPKLKSQFGDRGAHWKIPEDDVNQLKKIASYLARVCKARHS